MVEARSFYLRLEVLKVLKDEFLIYIHSIVFTHALCSVPTSIWVRCVGRLQEECAADPRGRVREARGKGEDTPLRTYLISRARKKVF